MEDISILCRALVVLVLVLIESACTRASKLGEQKLLTWVLNHNFTPVDNYVEKKTILVFDQSIRFNYLVEVLTEPGPDAVAGIAAFDGIAG